jgi:hypothetical protein
MQDMLGRSQVFPRHVINLLSVRIISFWQVINSKPTEWHGYDGWSCFILSIQTASDTASLGFTE